MRNSIKQITSACDACREHLDSKPKEEPALLTHSRHPMHKVGVDLFSANGEDWVVMVDHFSSFPFARRLRSTVTEAITRTLDDWFLDWGYPEVIRTDGGPQFRREFSEWAAERHVKHEVSSPYNPQSNALAEAAVKRCKKLLLKCCELDQDFRVALLEHRNTPQARSRHTSPAMAFLFLSLIHI